MTRLAGRQHGLVSWRQLRALGVGRDQVTRMQRRGLLHKVHPQVYAVGHLALSAGAVVLAGVATYGPHAALAGPSAMLGHGLLAPWQVPETVLPVHVALPREHQRRTRPGTQVHLVRLPEADVVRVGALRMTSVARTLVDLGADVGERLVERALDQALTDEKVTLPELHAALRRNAFRPGVGVLRRVVGRGERYAGLERSVLEAELRRLAVGAGQPAPEGNAEVPRVRGRLDAWWAAERVAVEVDGWRWHRTGERQHADRRKELDCRRAGILLLRYSARQVFEEPLVVVADLVAALERRRAVNGDPPAAIR